jgi:uncharacterized membrane protein YgdD (TMEM256/DUF423 family)
MMNTTKSKRNMQQLIILAAIFGALGVGIGAFGAHGLAATLEANGRGETFRTATLYHLIHALALLGAAWVSTQFDSQFVIYAGYAFVAGILLFSGSLYVLAIFNIGIMGAIAPLGGLAMIAGWILLGVATLQS